MQTFLCTYLTSRAAAVVMIFFLGCVWVMCFSGLRGVVFLTLVVLEARLENILVISKIWSLFLT